MGLEEAMEQINAAHGKGSVIRMGEKMEPQAVIPTGIYSLDKALGGGFARGRISEVFGAESAGKSTLAIQFLAEAQKLGTCAFIDVEHALDPNYAQTLGVDVKKLILSQPDSAEEALNIMASLVRSQEVVAVVLDSVAALSPEAELNGEVGDFTVGLIPRLLGQSLRQIKGDVQTTQTVLLFINQIRSGIGPVPYKVQPGGRAMKYFPSQRVDLSVIAKLENQGEVTGQTVRAKIVKNKIAPPFKNAEYDIDFGRGISKASSLITEGVKAGVVEKSGAFFKIEGKNIQGKEAAKRHLDSNPKIMQALHKALSDGVEA